MTSIASGAAPFSAARRLERRTALATILLPAAGTAVAIASIPVLGLTALDLALCASFYALTVLGITVGYHRLATHRGFEASPGLRAVLAVLGSMSAEGPILFWSACHRRHHAHSDAEDDPHSPVPKGSGPLARARALLWAHMAWMLDHEPEPWDRYVRDLLRDPVLFWANRTYPYWVAAGLALPGAIGGLVGGSWARAAAGVLWGGLVRMFLVQHVTWSVNSIGHTWGSRPFATEDGSRNNALCALLAFGEGWHNNHHAFQRSARHGLRWWELDVSYLAIRACAALGLARDVWTPGPEVVERARAGREG
jgi:stearoyl-CoA desaturase (delta-9 desaturase)